MDVAFQMRGVPHVILVDACRSGSEPGTLFEFPGADVEQLPPVAGINLHAFRWDHALAFAHWLLKDEYPARVTVLLVEGEQFEPGEPLSAPVDSGVDALCERILALVAAPTGACQHVTPPRPQPSGTVPWPAPGWHAGPHESEVADGKVLAFPVGDRKGVVIRSKSGLRAFRNNCAHAGLPLDTSAVDTDEGTLTCRWHAFRFDTESGRCLSAPQCRLEAWPLRVVDGVVWVCPS